MIYHVYVTFGFINISWSYQRQISNTTYCSIPKDRNMNSISKSMLPVELQTCKSYSNGNPKPKNPSTKKNFGMYFDFYPLSNTYISSQIHYLDEFPWSNVYISPFYAFHSIFGVLLLSWTPTNIFFARVLFCTMFSAFPEKSPSFLAFFFFGVQMVKNRFYFIWTHFLRIYCEAHSLPLAPNDFVICFLPATLFPLYEYMDIEEGGRS